MLEGTTIRQVWTRTRQLNARAGWRLVGVLTVLTVAGMMVLEVGLSKADQWAEVLGSGLTNLLCMVGVTGGVLGGAAEGGEDQGGGCA